MTTIEIFDFDFSQSWILAIRILVKTEDTAVIMTTEHTTVHATDHTRDQTAKKVSILKGVFEWPTILRNCLPFPSPPPFPYLVAPFGRLFSLRESNAGVSFEHRSRHIYFLQGIYCKQFLSYVYFL